MSLLVGDVAAVIKHLGREKAIIVGHDWGGAVAWRSPDDRAADHPESSASAGLRRELASNSQQLKNSQYARNFQQEGAHLKLTSEGLSAWVKDPQAKQKYPGALNNTWEWLEKDLTLVTIPGVGHFVQQDASDLVTRPAP